MSDQITYDDKADLIVDTTIDDIFKVSASDMNEIKNVVNGNAEEVGDTTSLTTTDKTNVVNAVNELNAPEKWVSVGATAPTDGERVWFKKSKNLLDYNSFVKGRINSSTGQIEYADNVSNITITSNSITYTSTKAWNSGITSEFIPIKQGEYIYKIKSASLKANVYIDYYDSSYNWLSRYGNKGINANEETTWAINFTNANAKYIRLHYEMGFADTITLTEAQLQQGTTATSYEPYIEASINVDEELLYQKPVVLWTNPNPTSVFASQTITLNDSLANYSYYEVLYKTYKDENIGYNTGKIPTNWGTNINAMVNASDGDVRSRMRSVTINSSTQIEISSCSLINTKGDAYTFPNDDRLIPFKILGYKE